MGRDVCWLYHVEVQKLQLHNSQRSQLQGDLPANRSDSDHRHLELSRRSRGTRPTCRSKRVPSSIVNRLQKGMKWSVIPEGIAQIRIVVEEQVWAVLKAREAEACPLPGTQPEEGLFVDGLAVLLLPLSLSGRRKPLGKVDLDRQF